MNDNYNNNELRLSRFTKMDLKAVTVGNEALL